MKNLILGIGMVIAGSSSAFGSRVVEYDLSKTLNKDQQKEFTVDLSAVLNGLQRCPEKERKSLQFGSSVTNIKVSSNRNGVTSYELIAQGNYPAPSFQPYIVTNHATLTPVPRENHPQDAPPLYKVECKVEYTKPSSK